MFFCGCGSSPYPLMLSLNLFSLFTCFLIFFKFKLFFFYFFYILFSFLCIVLVWSKDVVMEGLSGYHPYSMQSMLKLSFILFLFTELMFFFSIFWVFFDASLSPSIEIGGVWPPFGIVPPGFLGIPVFSTVVLLSSGVTATWSHAQLLSNNLASSSLVATILLSLVFLFFQVVEYFSLSFSLSDGIYGSIFYFSTGSHGMHVIFGTLFLTYNLIRLVVSHFSPTHHLGFEMAILYWHFVDLVWLFLYLFVYWWGS